MSSKLFILVVDDTGNNFRDMFGYDFEELAQRHGYNAVQLLELMVEDVIVGIKGKQYWIQGIVKHTTQHVQDLIQRTK